TKPGTTVFTNSSKLAIALESVIGPPADLAAIIVPVEGLRKFTRFEGAGGPLGSRCPRQEQACLELAQTQRFESQETVPGDGPGVEGDERGLRRQRHLDALAQARPGRGNQMIREILERGVTLEDRGEALDGRSARAAVHAGRGRRRETDAAAGAEGDRGLD